LELKPIGVGRAACAAVAALLCQATAEAQGAANLAAEADDLCKLAAFVDWPGAAGAAQVSTFDLCVIGDDPFGAVLDHAVVGQSVAGRPIVVRRLAAAEQATSCRIAFVAGSATQPVKAALLLLHGVPVLTVTHSADSPGMVDFLLDQNQLRFRIDDQAAADEGLSISSKLLGLAVSVTPRKSSAASP